MVSVWLRVLWILPTPSKVKPAEDDAVPSLFMTNLVVAPDEAAKISPVPLLLIRSAANEVIPENEAIDDVPPPLCPLTSKVARGDVVFMPILPVPLGLTERFSFDPVVISDVTPENVTVDVNDLLERFSIPARVAKVPVVGSVTFVAPPRVKVRSWALVVNAPPN